MRTVTEQHKAVLEGKLTKTQFLQEMRKEYPQYVTQFNGYEDAVRILKNRGMLYEEKAKLEKVYYNLSPEAVERGTRIELMNDGWDPSDTSCVMEREKAKERAVKNLEKDPLYYLNKMAGIKKSKKEVTADGLQIKSTPIDKTNGMKKVTLKESTYGDFKSWLETLYSIIMKDANLERSEIAVDTQELQTYYKEGKSPEDVYFNTWMQDAGNFRALGEEKRTIIKESIKNVIKNIFSPNKSIIKEHVTSPDNLAKFIDYQNERNPELAERVRDAAKKLSDHIYKIEKAYLDDRESIQEIYASIGSYLAPSVAAAFKEDVEEVFKAYFSIPTPKAKQVTPEDLQQAKEQGVDVVGVSESRTSLKRLLK